MAVNIDGAFQAWLKVARLFDSSKYESLNDYLSVLFDVTKEYFEKAIAGPGTDDLRMPLSKATINQRLQAWTEFKKVYAVPEVFLLNLKKEPTERRPLKRTFNPLHTFRVNLRMELRGERLLKTLEEKKKFLEDAVKSDREEFMKEQTQAILRYFKSQMSGGLGEALLAYSGSLHAADAIQGLLDSAAISFPVHEKPSDQLSQLSDNQNLYEQDLPSSTSLGDAEPEHLSTFSDVNLVVCQHQGEIPGAVSQALITKTWVQGEQSALMRSSRPVFASPCAELTKSLSTLQAPINELSTAAAKDGMSPLVSMSGALARTVSSTSNAASTAASTLSPAAENAAIGIDSATIGLAGCKLIVDSSLKAWDDHVNHQITRQKQITDDKNSDTLKQAADTGDRKANIDQKNLEIAKRLADAGDRKLLIEEKNADAARIAAYAAALTAETAREKALWEMKKDGKGKDGHGGSHGDSDDDKSHGTGPDPGNGGNGAADAGNVSRDPKDTARSAVDKVKGKFTDQRPKASSFASSPSGPCSATASAREKGDGVALEQTLILPKVPSFSKSALRVPPSPFDQQKQTVELNIIAAYVQQNKPTNVQIYEELQAEEKFKLAELEQKLGERRAKSLAEVPIPAHSKSPDVAGAATLSPKDNSKDRSHSSGGNGSSSFGPVAAVSILHRLSFGYRSRGTFRPQEVERR